MTLECTLVHGPAAANPGAVEELSLEVAPGTSGEALQVALEDARGVGTLFVDGQELSRLTVGNPPLVAGAVLVNGAEPRAEQTSTARLLLLAHSGPAAGSVFPLVRGTYRIGRGDADIAVSDPGMSRHHAVLRMSGTALELAATGRRNPVFVDGVMTEATTVTSQSLIKAGHSTFTAYTCTPCGPDIDAEAGRSVASAVEVRRVRPAGNRWALAATAGLPLLAGVGLAMATGMWMFLGFTVMSAVSLLVPALATRRARREFAQDVAEAAARDKRRRERGSPSAADLVLAASFHSSPGGNSRPGAAIRPLAALQPEEDRQDHRAGPRDVWLRLGLSDARANIAVVPDDPRFVPPSIGTVPVTLDPRHKAVALRGSNGHVDALVRFILMQMTFYAPGSPLIVAGHHERLPSAARFLPAGSLAANGSAALSALNSCRGKGSGMLVILDPSVLGEPGGPGSLVETAVAMSWRVVLHSPMGSEYPWKADVVLELGTAGTSALMVDGTTRHEFVPDLVPAQAFNRFARGISRAGSDGKLPVAGVPTYCPLPTLLPAGARSIQRRWKQSDTDIGLRAVLGVDAQGEVEFDFHTDGPHLLIGGTTGSGKSELLRTLVASMALRYPPDVLQFLFFDFKGGSGLGLLGGLPHCVGMVTDIGGQALGRVLASLRGEIRRRETIFAEARVSALVEYRQGRVPSDPVIASLVIVIDEFRMLVDDAPAVLAELMRIATIGRSLGIHLVMATQRPQGAVTADIRANVTSSIALRVQSDAESMDIIRSKSAASIPITLPGRSFLARAAGQPEEFQAATLDTTDRSGSGCRSPFASPGVPGRTQRTVVVRSAAEALLQVAGGTRPATASQDPTATRAGADTIIAGTTIAWRGLERELPPPPMAEPLPSSVPWDQDIQAVLGEARDPRRGCVLGVLDRPEQQALEVLAWCCHQGHLAMIGSISSGMPEAFRAAAALAAAQGTEPHLYILDAHGMFPDVFHPGTQHPDTQGPGTQHPGTQHPDSQHSGTENPDTVNATSTTAGIPDSIGALVGLHQVSLALKVLQRLADEMARRRAAAGSHQKPPTLLLVVTGWCSWASAFRECRSAWAEDLFRDIVRDGAAVGVTVLVSGERELVSARFFGSIPNRAFFPADSTEESRFHWPRIPDLDPVPGRAWTMGSFVGGSAAAAQFRSPPVLGTWPFRRLAPATSPPFRVRPLPGTVTRQQFHAAMANTFGAPQNPDVAPVPRMVTPSGTSAGPLDLWVGLGGDDAVPIALPLPPGGICTVLGGRLSGKSSLLAALRELNPGVPWIASNDTRSPEAFLAAAAAAAEAGTLDSSSVLQLDDADQLGADGRRILAFLKDKVRGLVLTATSGPTLVQRLPLAVEAQSSGAGAVLMPRSPLDGDFFNIRLEADPGAGAGRGYIVQHGRLQPFQAAYTV